MDEEDYGELSDRIDGLRLIISVLISSMPDRLDVMWKLQQAEAMARQRNMATGVLEEMANLRETLDDL